MKRFEINEKVEYCKNNMKMFDTLDEAIKVGEDVVANQGHSVQYLCMDKGELTVTTSFQDEDTEEIVTAWFSLTKGIAEGRTIYCLENAVVNK